MLDQVWALIDVETFVSDPPFWKLPNESKNDVYKDAVANAGEVEIQCYRGNQEIEFETDITSFPLKLLDATNRTNPKGWNPYEAQKVFFGINTFKTYPNVLRQALRPGIISFYHDLSLHVNTSDLMSSVKRLIIEEERGPDLDADLNRHATSIPTVVVEDVAAACPVLRDVTIRVRTWAAHKQRFCDALEYLSDIYTPTNASLRGGLSWEFDWKFKRSPIVCGCFDMRRDRNSLVHCPSCFEWSGKHEDLKAKAHSLRASTEFRDPLADQVDKVWRRGRTRPELLGSKEFRCPVLFRMA